MKVAVIHPLKHHVYYSMEGIMKSGAEVIGLFGYYNKGDFIDWMLKRTSLSILAEGWKYNPITVNVKTNWLIKILFLLYKAKPDYFEKVYFKKYQKWVINNLKGVDCIHVLQDYCNDVIRYAKQNGIKIVYEQIIALDYERYYSKDESDLDTKKSKEQQENLEYADLIITASKFVNDSIVSRMKESNLKDKIIIIPYGVDSSQFSCKIKKANCNEKVKLLTIASISYRKGINFLVEAMKKMTNLPIQLTLIGSMYENDLAWEIEKTKNIIYKGTVAHETINNYYDENDIFILPSLAEGSSLSIYEALASGLPCIVTENCGSVVTNMLDGLVIKTNSTDSIVDAVKYFVDNPNMVEKMSKAASETIKNYTWTIYSKKISEAYKNKILME